MTLTQFVNATALVLTCAIVFGRGRGPERLGMTVLAMAFLVTPLVQARGSWYEPQYGILTVDALTLAALIAMSFWCDRYWPICAAAFQAVAVLTHVAFLIDPTGLYRAFYFGNFAIGFLLLGSILGGTLIEVAPIRFRPRLASRASSSVEP